MTEMDEREMWRRAREMTDPRQFQFVILCHLCGEKRNTTAGINQHVRHECSRRPQVDLECGHCGLRVTSWPLLAQHLNQKGMHWCKAIRADMRAIINRPPAFPNPLPPMKETMLKTMAMKAKRYNALQCYPASIVMRWRQRRRECGRPSSPARLLSCPTMKLGWSLPLPLSDLEFVRQPWGHPFHHQSFHFQSRRKWSSPRGRQREK